MPKFVIPVTYTMSGSYEIEADTILDALDQVLGPDANLPLPENAEYVSDSFFTDSESVIEANNLSRVDQDDVIVYLEGFYGND